MNTKLTAFIFILLLGQTYAFANDIVCLSANTNQVAFRYSSNNPIPDFSFEKFQMHSSFGVVSIHDKDVGATWISVKNGGHQLFYEIKAGNAQPPHKHVTHYVHLSLYKDGSSFNGYMQGPNAEMELLQCSFAN